MFTSSYVQLDKKNKLSINYKNLYCINGEYYFFSINQIELPIVSLWNNQYLWRPTVKLFNNQDEIKEYTKDFESIDLATTCVLLWPHNIGHALFDGFFGCFTALTKFNFYDKDFFFLCKSKPDYNLMCYNIIEKFSRRTILDISSKKIKINNLIVGNGGCGNYVVNKECEVYGQKQFRSMSLFKERMLASYDLDANKKVNKKINAIIINNKRFNKKDFESINKTIDFYKNSKKINLKFINYGDYKSFYEQMEMISDIDLHISGPGTGICYMPFLKNNAVNINLGHTWYHPSGYKIPSFMEQRICSAADYVNTLYYDRYTYEDIEFEPLISLIEKSIYILNNNLKNDTNLNIDALVFNEYCNLYDKYEELCDYLTNTFTTWIEFFVNEHPETIKNFFDKDLLTKAKEKFKYPYYKIK
jgi:hypothetical protein